MLSPSNFNSHAHVERDWIGYRQSVNRSISTHTLTWSVTKFLDDARTYKIISTHTLTWSVTFWWKRMEHGKEFQLTRSRGAWPAGNEKTVHEFTFQLTRSRGAWLWSFKHRQNTVDISTHTLTWSVTCNLKLQRCNYIISTHTLTWSVTPNSVLLFINNLISTHTLTWSVTALFFSGEK